MKTKAVFHLQREPGKPCSQKAHTGLEHRVSSCWDTEGKHFLHTKVAGVAPGIGFISSSYLLRAEMSHLPHETQICTQHCLLITFPVSIKE